MREIKFRAFIKSTKEIVDVEWIDFINKQITYHRIDFKGFGLVSTASFEEIELIQYTNLNDRNGKEIYEGDIVKIGDYPPYEVIVNDFSMIHCIDNELEQEELFRYHKNCRVIGNIYEHPHLLGGDS